MIQIEGLKDVFSRVNLPYIFGLSSALFAFHSPILTLTIKGDTWLFLPQIALMFMMGVLAIFWMTEKLDFGPKKIYIPLLIIATSPLINFLIYPSGKSLSGGLFGFVLFFIYLYSRGI